VLIEIWTKSSGWMIRWPRNVMVDSAPIRWFSSSENHTVVGQPVVPVVVLRYAGRAPDRTNASPSSRSASFGVTGRRAMSSYRRLLGSIPALSKRLR
jgi:hypothetical protein